MRETEDGAVRLDRVAEKMTHHIVDTAVSAEEEKSAEDDGNKRRLASSVPVLDSPAVPTEQPVIEPASGAKTQTGR